MKKLNCNIELIRADIPYVLEAINDILYDPDYEYPHRFETLQSVHDQLKEQWMNSIENESH